MNKKPIIVTVIDNHGNGDILCIDEGGNVMIIDPFVGCAIKIDEQNSIDQIKNMIGKKFKMNNYWWHFGAWLCNNFDEVI